jgi:hypothetical protein
MEEGRDCCVIDVFFLDKIEVEVASTQHHFQISYLFLLSPWTYVPLDCNHFEVYSGPRISSTIA